MLSDESADLQFFIHVDEVLSSPDCISKRSSIRKVFLNNDRRNTLVN